MFVDEDGSDYSLNEMEEFDALDDTDAIYREAGLKRPIPWSNDEPDDEE